MEQNIIWDGMERDGNVANSEQQAEWAHVLSDGAERARNINVFLSLPGFYLEILVWGGRGRGTFTHSPLLQTIKY